MSPVQTNSSTKSDMADGTIDDYQCCTCFSCFPTLEDVHRHECTVPETTHEQPSASLDTPEGFNVWPHAAILLLITTYIDKREEFNKSNKRKDELWKEIADVLLAASYPVNGEMCEEKMDSLKHRYFIIKDKALKTGQGNDEQWPYYEILDGFLACDPSVIPLAVEASLEVPSASHSGFLDPPVCTSRQQPSVPSHSTVTQLPSTSFHITQPSYKAQTCLQPPPRPSSLPSPSLSPFTHVTPPSTHLHHISPSQPLSPASQPPSPASQPPSPASQPSSPASQPPSPASQPPSPMASVAGVLYPASVPPRGRKRRRMEGEEETARSVWDQTIVELRLLRETQVERNNILRDFTQQNHEHHKQLLQQKQEHHTQQLQQKQEHHTQQLQQKQEHHTQHMQMLTQHNENIRRLLQNIQHAQAPKAG